MAFYRLVTHDSLGRMPEHLCYIEVEWFRSVALLEREMRISGGFTHYIHRRSFAFGNPLHVLQMLLIDKESHTFLAFVGDDFFRAERLIPNG